MSTPSVAGLIREIAEDNTSGAAELTKKGAHVLLLLARETTATEMAQFLSELVGTGRRLIHAQPSMAPLFNLVNTVLSSLETVRDVDQAKSTAKDMARAFAAELDARANRIALEALALISDGSRILTHSRSSTLLATFHLARDRDRSFRVLCTESRPAYEGRVLARELHDKGVDTTLITDAALADFVSQVDLVMVGADSVSAQGLVNKTGTYGLALAASAQGVPFYALGGSEKFLPPNYPHLEIQPKDPQEVWKDRPKGVTVLNYYFDTTPLEHLSGLVTEKGLLTGSQVEEMLARLKVHEMLL